MIRTFVALPAGVRRFVRCEALLGLDPGIIGHRAASLRS
ncbi:MAG: hypothetical protein HSCHL_2326 [Hydrogenibacillus schlegelii]|uniref:Uncharacterized protein n=1 Tax=Hydrogenibacillus schlegelii TaxID=1484 RepID=A0A2T5GEZ8_HYDSH|nr:MAG: hypothetical protein HSCHL_2326 [Hydrogenibacillus schlegelii]